MKLYFKIIFVTLIIIMALGINFAAPIYHLSFFDCSKIILMCLIWTAVINLGIMFITKKIPLKRFDENLSIYKSLKWEKKFYEKLGVKKWKDKIPECGGIGNFRKNKVLDKNNNEYIKQFLLETCYAETLHVLCGIFGFVIIFLLPLKYFWCFTLPFTFVHFLLHLMPIMVQRYNRPKLLLLYKWNLEKEEKLFEEETPRKV